MFQLLKFEELFISKWITNFK